MRQTRRFFRRDARPIESTHSLFGICDFILTGCVTTAGSLGVLGGIACKGVSRIQSTIVTRCYLLAVGRSHADNRTLIGEHTPVIPSLAEQPQSTLQQVFLVNTRFVGRRQFGLASISTKLCVYVRGLT